MGYLDRRCRSVKVRLQLCHVMAIARGRPTDPTLLEELSTSISTANESPDATSRTAPCITISPTIWDQPVWLPTPREQHHSMKILTTIPSRLRKKGCCNLDSLQVSRFCDSRKSFG
jgi:hypothetical protein